jgi:hypothetical protein
VRCRRRLAHLDANLCEFDKEGAEPNFKGFARERAAIAAVPAAAWQIAVDARGQVRERRADDACSDLSCGHRRCWIEEAHVTELTSLLREGPGGDQLGGWPATMRVFARRERPHPGAQLSLFETAEGWRYSLWVTNRPAATKGWPGQNAYIDATHRVHARVEDAIRTGKDCGIGKYPSTSLAMNKAWQAAGASSRSPRPGPGHLRSQSPGTVSAPWPRHPDQHADVPAIKEGTGARGTPGNPARQPGPCHTRTLKSRSTTWPDGQPRPVTGQRE